MGSSLFQSLQLSYHFILARMKIQLFSYANRITALYGLESFPLHFNYLAQGSILSRKNNLRLPATAGETPNSILFNSHFWDYFKLF